MTDPKPIIAYLYVGLGGAAGSVVRFAVAQYLNKVKPENPFLAVASVNIIGSLLIGLFAGHFTSKDNALYFLLVVGFLGGFTTFSSYSLDLLAMLQRQLYGQAALFALAQVILGVGAAAAGFAITTKLL
ncbi:MAG: fluoride efflux transporter CrcB [Fimbriimonadaceae bacterium]